MLILRWIYASVNSYIASVDLAMAANSAMANFFKECCGIM